MSDTPAKEQTKWYRYSSAARYLSEALDIPMSEKTLRNRCCDGKGPTPAYFGSRPLFSQTELDRWIAENLRTTPEKPWGGKVKKILDGLSGEAPAAA